ncbi:penicillin-binding protein activator [Entomobacter blattae]|uniref:Penicillin-binding protein activator LpoA n=1 Tax=Entomobacter blattae TaxID=2762277 RepID=A0A7H1NQH6_9PROT|nr:penicillin-binding protein activator [Entomobacter blattae]QNT78036.1 Penicillin-binding protein activator LpoA [Entomobacter blattae]
MYRNIFTVKGTNKKQGLPYGLAVCLLMGVAACSHSSPQSSGGEPALSSSVEQGGTTPGKVGIFLPLSGRNGGLGHNMLNAAKLALADEKDLTLDIHDSGGDMSRLVNTAIQNGDGIIIGPLTAENTGKLSSAAKMAGIPVLAFTSDIHQAQPGVWVMGITPEQQVAHLVKAAKAEGRQHFAAFLPDTALGHALGDGLISACEQENLAPAHITYHTSSKTGVVEAMKLFADYTGRQTQTSSSLSSSSASSSASSGNGGDNLLAELDPAATSSGAPQAAASPAVDQASSGTSSKAPQTLAPPAFDALLLGDTGVQLQYVIDALEEVQVSSQKVRILGPGLWAAFSSKLGSLAGAWYASSDPESRRGFVSKYLAKYHTSPKPLADLAYDSGALVGNLHKNGGYTVSNLTRPEGFLGVGGAFSLLPNGHVRRELAIFEIQPQGSAVMKKPAVQTTAEHSVKTNT